METPKRLNFKIIAIFLAVSTLVLTQLRCSRSDNNDNVLGDVTEEDQSIWDTFYRQRGAIKLEPPIEIIKDLVPLLKNKAKVLVPAMGEGRNAIYLAQHGYDVTGVDISEVAVHRAQAEARARKVKFNAVIADLNVFPMRTNYWDAVVVSLFHLKSLLPKWRDAIRPGGYLVYFNPLLTEKRTRSGEPQDYFIKKNEIENFYKDWKVVKKMESTVNNQVHLSIILQKP